MTVCVALMADRGKKVVVAADKMLTYMVGNLQYQINDDNVKKIIKLNGHVFALIAGTPDRMAPIFEKITVREDEQPQIVAERVKDAYADYAKRLKEEQILKPVGLDWPQYLAAQNSSNSDLTKDLYKKLNDFSASAQIGEIIVAGYNTTTELCYIGIICGSNGNVILIDRNTFGFAAIGSGLNHAQAAAIQLNYNKNLSLARVETIMKQAMQEAAKAPGVGALGEMYTLPTSNGQTVPPTNNGTPRG